MPTLFTPKKTGDILYAGEINAIYQAINNLEEAIGLTPGTAQAQIDPEQLADGIPASKLEPSSSGTLRDLTIQGLLSVRDLNITGEAGFGNDGRVVLRNALGVPILTIGKYDPVYNRHGLQAWDGQRVTFSINDEGKVEIQGKVIADEGSSFTGIINARSGIFSGDVQVGGPNGVLIRGSTGDIVAGVNGKIYGGGTVISSTGIQIFEGELNIADKAIITRTGQATFTEANITGTITALAGSIGGIQIDQTGIYTGDRGISSGFHIKASGDVVFSSGTFRGTIQALDGSIEGTLSVAGALQAGDNVFAPSGIVIRSGSINLGNGAFVVSPEGVLYANAAEIAGTIHVGAGEVVGTFEVGSNVTLSPEGIEVSGPAGVRVTGTGGIEVTSGSVVVKSADPVPREVVRLGSWIENAIEHRGIRVHDGTRTTFEVLETGDVTVRGTIYADTGEFTGRIVAQSGELQNLTVTGTVDVTSGAIRAGTTTLSSEGLFLTQGRINLADRFIVDEEGRLTATDANLTGSITATAGAIAGDLWIGSGVVLSGTTGQIIAGQTTLSASGISIRQGSILLGPSGEFAVSDTGQLTATAAAIRGHVDATSGSIQGTFTVGEGVTLSPDGILVSGTQGIRVRGGSVVVRDAGDTTDLVVLGRYTTPEGASGIGLLITDGAQSVLQATQTGGLSLRGEITATGGRIEGDLSVSGRLMADGVILDDSTVQVLSPVPSAAIPGVGLYYQPEITMGHLSDPEGYGLRAGNVELSSAGLISPGFRLLSTGEFEARSGKFGTTIHAIHLDSTGFYHGEAYGAVGSNFGINALTGDAYFRGTVAVGQNSEMAGDMRILPGGRLYVGTDYGRRIEIVDSDTRTGLFAFDDQNQEKFAIALQTAGLEVRGALAVTGGTFKGNVTVGPGQEVRIVGSPEGLETVPGIYLYEPDPSTRILRLSYDGLSFSTDGGYTWQPAMTGSGVNANAITDGTLTITDTTGSADGILVRRRVVDEAVTMPYDTSYIPLAHGRIQVISVTNTARTVVYQPGVDYTVNPIDGLIARTPNSAIPGGATVLVTYDWSVIEISSQAGIRVYEGDIEVHSKVTGTTLIGGGYLRVDGLDTGVTQSDNYIANGNFSLVSDAWDSARTNDGADLPGYPPYPAGQGYFGDWVTDRMGRTYRYGAAFWIPNKSDTTYDEMGHTNGYAQVGFAPHDFLHNIYGYVNLLVAGATAQFAQVEQDVYPFFNYSDGDFIIPTERFEDVVVSAGFHWHKEHTPRNTVTLEVDELVPHFVFVEATRTTPFTPVWDNVHETYQGLVYSPGWSFIDDASDDHHGIEGTGDNLAYGCTVSSNGSIVPGTAFYAVDNHFVRESWATKVTGSGPVYLQVDLGSVQIVNQIWVWHSTDARRRYRSTKLEVSVDGVTWETIFDSATHGLYAEGINGKKHSFSPRPVRYIRDWVDGYEVLDPGGNPTGQVILEHQWLDIQVRRWAYAVTTTPGAYVEWTFTPHSRCDLWIGFIRGPGHGVGYVEIDGKRVATIDQGIAIGGEEDAHYELAYVDVSSQEDLQLVPRKPHTVRIVFEDRPENVGKHFTLTRIKLEDFRLEGPQHTTVLVVASANVRPANPYAFYYASVVPRKAQFYTGKGRQILRGMYDIPANFSPSSNVWLRYRVRIRSERAAGGDVHEHDHVMVSQLVMEKGTKPTRFRRSSLDITPSQILTPWKPQMPDVTGVHTEHLADGAVTSPKIAPSSITDAHIAPNAAIATSKIAFGPGELHSHPNQSILDQITGFGASGSSTDVARADHVHTYQELTNRPIRIWQIVELTSPIAQGAAYTLPGGMTYTPGSYELAIYLDGRRLIPGHDYQETSPSQVTFLMDIPAGSHLLFDRIPLS